MDERADLEALDVLEQGLALHSLSSHDIMVLLMLAHQDILHQGHHISTGIPLCQTPLHRLQQFQKIVVHICNPAQARTPAFSLQTNLPIKQIRPADTATQSLQENCPVMIVASAFLSQSMLAPVKLTH